MEGKRNFESEKFFIRLRGSSRDLRTNVWEMKCKKCGKSISPRTTMMPVQLIQCKCGESESINYNELN